jgi:hypothetical protein
VGSISVLSAQKYADLSSAGADHGLYVSDHAISFQNDEDIFFFSEVYFQVLIGF